MSESGTNPELGALESALRGLQPAPAELNRDQVMYRAGQASMSGRRGLWPAATAALLLAVIGLGTALVLRTPAVPAERIVYVHVPQPVDAVPTDNSAANDRVPSVAVRSDAIVSPLSYAQLREQVARHGVEALPEAPSVMKTTSSPTNEPSRRWWKLADEPLSPGI